MTASPSAVLGLRVKTGRAMAVILLGSRRSPRPGLRREIALADPKQPHTVHPYHLELEGRADVAAAAAERTRQIGRRALEKLFETLDATLQPRAVAVVVNSNTPPERIGSAHMRAHSREGWLFREICEDAAQRLGVEPATLLCDDIHLDAAATQRALTLLATGFGRPWTLDWKLAAAAAWQQLA